MIDKIIEELELNNNLIIELENKVNSLKENLIQELKNSEEKNYRNEKALYSLKVNSNDKFNEDKLKEEHEDIYNNYLKTKISFDVTTFKKKEKELVEKYTEKGIETYSLRIEEIKVKEIKENEIAEEIEI